MGTQIREEKVQCQQGQQGPNFDEAAARRLHHLYHHQVPVPKAWARVTKHSDCFKSKGHQDWKAAEILCAPLLVCTVSSQILNYVFPGNRKRRKKQLKNDAKKQNTPKKKGEKKHIPRKLRILFRIVWFAFLACVRILWHLHGFVFSVGFVCVYVVLLLLCLFFPAICIAFLHMFSQTN